MTMAHWVITTTQPSNILTLWDATKGHQARLSQTKCNPVDLLKVPLEEDPNENQFIYR